MVNFVPQFFETLPKPSSVGVCMDINDALTVSLYSLIPGTGTQAFNHLRGPRPSCRPALCQETFKPKGGGRFNAAICNPKSLAKGQSK